MKSISRRALLGATVFAPVALPGCAALTGNPLQKTITVNLAAAQAEAKTIETALGIVLSSVQTALPASIAAKASAAIATLSKAVAAFAAVPSGSTTVATLAGDVIAAASAVVALIPLPPATGLAINSGLAILSALIAGLATVTVTTSPPATGVKAARVIPGPVPVPVS